MRPNAGAAAVSAALQFLRAFSATVVYRQVPVAYEAMSWHASPPGGRWNPTFPALYAALDLDVALAERIKRTGPVRSELAVGLSRVRFARVLDLRSPDVRTLLRVARDALTRDDYRATHALASRLFVAGIRGLLVPAALTRVAGFYPHFWFERDGEPELRRTPAGGTNLVVFPDHVAAGDEREEIGRFHCAIWGTRARGSRSST
jgi:RES domain-containing protein